MALELLKADRRFEVADSDLEGIADGDPEVVYVYRQIPASVTRELVNKHSKFKAGREQRDGMGLLDDMLDYALVEWRGVVDGTSPAECNRGNKVNGLDPERKNAIVNLAARMAQRTKEERQDSFRSPASVL